MGYSIRISGRGVCTVAVSDLASGQAAAVRDLLGPSGSDRGGIELSQTGSSATPSLLIRGTREQIALSVRLLSSRGIVSGDLAGAIHTITENYFRTDYRIACRNTTLDLGSRPHIMGILNVTPDSFSDGGRYDAVDRAVARAREMADEGADIIDIGGESTRPGADSVSEDEELRRIIPVIRQLAQKLDVPLSVDTYKSGVAQKALEAGASMVNDISGLRFSPDMAKVAADFGAAVVIMHIKGTPRDMQQHPAYKDVVGEIMDYLEAGIEIALRAGVEQEQVLIDPGIGFGKTLDHNLTILNRLDELKALGRPIVLGTSRKKFIGTVLGIPVPEQRVDGTASTVALGIDRGARIVRVHDVARMAHVVRMTDAIVTAARQG